MERGRLPGRSLWRVPGKAMLLVLVAPVVAAGVPAATASGGPRLIVYGDSLVYEAAPYVHRLLGEIARVEGKVLGAPGAATCDLFEEMRRDAARYRPAAVVLGFSGNALTPCMKDEYGQPLGGDAWLAKYRHDTLIAIQALRPMGAPVWLASAPIGLVAQTFGDDGVRRLAAMHREVAKAFTHVHVADAGRAVLDDGRWTRTLPCLPREPCTGGLDAQGRWVNQVRAPDGVHFCPVPYPKLETCPVHASGGLRYALGMIVPPLRHLSWFDPARYARSLGAGWR